MVLYFCFAIFSVLVQLLSEGRVSSRRFCIKTQPIRLLHASVSRIRFPHLCGRASTCADSTLFCSIANASFSSAYGCRASLAHLFNPCVERRTCEKKCRTNYQYMLHSLKWGPNWAFVRNGLKPLIASVLWSASLNVPDSIACHDNQPFLWGFGTC